MLWHITCSQYSFASILGGRFRLFVTSRSLGFRVYTFSSCSEIRMDFLQSLKRKWFNLDNELREELHMLREEFHTLRDEFHTLRRELNRVSNLHIGAERDKIALTNDLQKRTREVGVLEQKVDAMEKEHAEEALGGSYSDASATPTLYEAALSRAMEALGSFSQAFASRLDSSAWQCVFARKFHSRYAVQAAVSSILFFGFESEDFGTDGGLSKHLDVKELRSKSFEEFNRFQFTDGDIVVEAGSDFAKFIGNKLSHLNSAFRITGMEEDQQNYQSFMRLAVAVWRLHRLAFSFYPPARIVRIKPGTQMDAQYMENVIDEDDLDRARYELLQEVAFMIFPGFTVRRTVFKSRVYPSLKPIEVHSDA